MTSVQVQNLETAVAETGAGKVRGVVVDGVKVFEGISVKACSRRRRPERERAWKKRLGGDPSRLIDAYRTAHPEATPWDPWILIATDHPRGSYSRELAKRKAEERSARVFAYRYDWETPEGGRRMRSPRTIEILFVFNNIDIPVKQVGQ